MPPKIIGPIFHTLESILNQTVNIECKSFGIPMPTNFWSLNGRTVFPSEKIEVNTENFT